MFKFQDSDADFKALTTLDASLIQLVDTGENKLTGKPRAPRIALVTGANGFVGSHLTAHLAGSDRWDKVFALVRDETNFAASHKLKDSWTKWKVNAPSNTRHKVETYTWDPMSPRLGMSEQQFSTLAWHSDVVFHLAGATAYDKNYKHMRAGTSLLMLQLLDFCRTGQPKQLHHIGSIADRIMSSVKHKERNIPWTSGYFQAKWVVDKMLTVAREQLDIPTTNYRAPYITGPTTHAMDPQRHYSFWQMAIALASAGLIWDGYFLQAVPVDLLCQCLAMNAQRSTPLPVVTPTMLPLHTSRIMGTLGCDLIDHEEFFDHVAPHMPAATGLPGARYRDVEVASTGQGDLDRFIAIDKIPDAAEMFKRGFRQQKIQKAVQRAQGT